MRIAVIGSGYVGLVSAACFAEIGHEVECVDNDVNKIAMLQRGEIPIHERHLPELIQRHSGGRLNFSTSVIDAVEKAEAVFITVGTPPSANGEADLSFVEAVAIEIASALREHKVVVEKSTVPVRTCEWLTKSLSLNGAPAGSFSVASNPEFLREGTAVSDFLYPDRIVVGVDDELSAAVLEKIYEPLTTGTYYSQKEIIPAPGGASLKARIIVTNAKSAELIKHASNAFLAMKISFVNALANVAESVGADITQVCDGVGSDSRIGPRFLNAGIGYGGSCFPKDVQAFQAVANNCGCDFGMLTEVMRVNTEQRRIFLKKVRSALWTLRGKKLAVLGLAFKADTDDIRESPAIEIIESLLKEGAQVRAYDPAAMAKSKKTLGENGIEYAKNAYDAMDGSDALLILTEWKEFSALDLNRIRSLLKYPIVIDGRNLYEPRQMIEAGLLYHSIGRATVAPKLMLSKTMELNSRDVPKVTSSESASHTVAAA
jgi:UDPglucose 6-dehydrogenase